ncbi:MULTISPECIES: hypothetical protein [unclassified Streptomyces]|uniref:hypothetical protein n=1 Tax=unclassified Streptomyces TaxID=2593676 RepID=UPI002E2F568D|nr:hypothetical protein [Streptomyces sp. NBC_01268]
MLAYVLNQRGEVRRARRQARLDRLNAQLKELYGPLLVLVESNERTWDAFRERHQPSREERQRAGGLTEEQDRLWRRWVLTVFVPTARRMREIIVTHGDLFVEDEIPPVVMDFCAHVASYEVTLVAWEAGEDEDVLVRHPGDGLADYVRGAYQDLKATQSEVLSAQT